MRPRQQILRCSDRLPLVLPARCRSRSGFLDNVVMTDISPEGCRIERRGIGVLPGDLVTLRPVALELISGVVRWVGGDTAGIRFDNQLYGPVVEYLHRTYETYLGSNQAAVPDRRRVAA